MELNLYYYWRSSASWRVLIAAHYKGIKLHKNHVDLRKGEHLFHPYLKTQSVPALVLADSTVITDSMAIIQYFEDLGIGNRLIPESPTDAAIVRMICGAIVSDIHPVQNLRVIEYAAQIQGHTKGSPLYEEAKKDFAKHWITRGLYMVEQLLQSTSGDSGDFCFGGTLTLADICLIPQVYNAERFVVDMSRYPRINRIVENCLKLECFRETYPRMELKCFEETLPREPSKDGKGVPEDVSGNSAVVGGAE